MTNTIQFAAKGSSHYYPELGESKPIAQMYARFSYDAKYVYITTKINLKESRSIKIYDEQCAGMARGFKKYRLTINAFDKIENQYSVSWETLLD